MDGDRFCAECGTPVRASEETAGRTGTEGMQENVFESSVSGRPKKRPEEVRPFGRAAIAVILLGTAAMAVAAAFITFFLVIR